MFINGQKNLREMKVCFVSKNECEGEGGIGRKLLGFKRLEWNGGGGWKKNWDGYDDAFTRQHLSLQHTLTDQSHDLNNHSHYRTSLLA